MHPPSLKDLEAQALALPDQERAELAARLLESLSLTGEIDPQWAAEVDRRVAEIEAGRANMAPVASTVAKVRDLLHRQ